MKHRNLESLTEEPVSHNPEIRKRVMFRKGDLPHLTNFAQARFAPGQTATPHSHQDMTEVFFVSAGEGEIRVDGVAHRVAAGDCLAIEAGENHEVINTGPSELVLTYFGIAP
ncbi:MAG: cupin domain-containing protein [Cyanobacteria bacterium P01_A01_bin.123]